jgi:hypothetical protein
MNASVAISATSAVTAGDLGGGAEGAGALGGALAGAGGAATGPANMGEPAGAVIFFTLRSVPSSSPSGAVEAGGAGDANETCGEAGGAKAAGAGGLKTGVSTMVDDSSGCARTGARAPGRGPGGADGGGAVGAGAAAGGGGAAADAGAGFRAMNTCWQRVHCTGAPLGGIRFSSRSYNVPQLSHLMTTTALHYRTSAASASA